ncbi:MAG: zf-TFIIB domain-containing protein [Thermoleophilia bacterium]
MEQTTRSLNASPGCPNDGTALKAVQAASRQGTAILLDQCQCCGGIWFDKWELFQAAGTRIKELAEVDLDNLRCPAGRRASAPVCPRCGSGLKTFSDPHIPASIQMLICDGCEGFWLNHGEAAGYADFRSQRQQASSERLAEKYEKMLQASSNKEYWQGVERLGQQLGGQRDPLTGLPLSATAGQLDRIDEAQDVFFAIMGTLARLLFRWL